VAPKAKAKNGIIGIQGIDTRAVTKRLRLSGSLKGAIGSGDPSDPLLSDKDLVERARAWPGLGGVDMVAEETCGRPYQWTKGVSSPFHHSFKANRPGERVGEGFRIVAYDFGIKHNILRIFYEMGFDVFVLPAHATADEARALRPDGIFLSNGPGDPEGLPYAMEAIQSLMDDYPIFGICLGLCVGLLHRV